MPQLSRAASWGGTIGPLAVRTIRGGSHSIARTPPMITQADPEHILLYLLREGSCHLEQDGRSCRLQPGDLASHDTSRPSMVVADTRMELFVVGFPKWLIGPHLESISRRTATRIPAGEELRARLAGPLLAGLGDVADRGDLPLPASEGAVDILLATLRALHDDPTSVRPLTRGGALLAHMREYALAHLKDPDLGPERIARAHFVSTRYVHMLFATAGTGVAEWIRARRLEGAMRDLRDPAAAHRPIADIAASRGFVDPAGFSRVCRRAYGRSPRELRNAA